MEYSEIKKQLLNPDTLTEGLANLDDYNNAMITERDTLKNDKETSDKRIRDLQDSNMRLYLRITGDSPKEEPDEDTRNDYEKLLEKLRNERVKQNGN